MLFRSTDYYREKYDKYIGIPLKIHNETTDVYKEWSNIWGKNEDINSIMLYFNGIIKVYRKNTYPTYTHDTRKGHWLTEISPNDLFDTFEKYIGSTNEVNDYRYSYVHPVVKEQIYDTYIKENIRFFKLLKILEDE